MDGGFLSWIEKEKERKERKGINIRKYLYNNKQYKILYLNVWIISYLKYYLKK